MTARMYTHPVTLALRVTALEKELAAERRAKLSALRRAANAEKLIAEALTLLAGAQLAVELEQGR